MHAILPILRQAARPPVEPSHATGVVTLLYRKVPRDRIVQPAPLGVVEVSEIANQAAPGEFAILLGR